MLMYGKDYQIKKISVEEKIELKNGLKVKEIGNLNLLKEILERDKYYKLHIKLLVKTNIILFAGFYSGNAYLFSLDKIHNLKLLSKNKNNDKIQLNYFKEGFITSLEVSQDEKYIISGNNKGTLVILELLYNNNNISKDENNIKLIKIISSHSGYSITSISISSDMNLFGDCSYDNFIHIYTLPKCDKIISIFNKDQSFYPDFIFISAQPLPSIILYSNETTKFKIYSINGKDLNIEQDDKNLLNESKYKNKNICENMISPFLFTNSQFNDYLIYIFRYQYIILRKAPLMDLVFKINFNENEYISMINLSLTKEYVYAADYNNKKVYIINYDKCKPISKDDNNQENVIENSNNNNIEIK
jgi:WD40 repeat protein